MAIAYRDVAHGSTTATTTITVAKPAGVVQGDAMLAAIKILGNETITGVPTGWTLVRSDNSGGASGDRVLLIYRKVAGASEPASYDWTKSASATAGSGGIIAFSGTFDADFVDVHSGAPINPTGNSTSITGTSVTTTVANTMLVGFFLTRGTAPIAPDASMTERLDNTTAPANIEYATEARPTAGATGDRTAVASGANAERIATLVAIKEASSSNFSGSVTVTGGGDAVVVGAKGAASTVSATGGGDADVEGSKGAAGAVAVPGGGDVTLVGTGAHGGSVSISGGGSVTTSGSGTGLPSVARRRSVIDKRHLPPFVPEMRRERKSGSVSVSGGGAITCSGTARRSGRAVLTGGARVALGGHADHSLNDDDDVISLFVQALYGESVTERQESLTLTE